MIEEPAQSLSSSFNDIFDSKQNDLEINTGICYLRNDHEKTLDTIKDHESFDDGFLLDYLIKNEEEEEKQKLLQTESNGQIYNNTNNMKTCSPAQNIVESENEESLHGDNILNKFFIEELTASSQSDVMLDTKYIESSIQETNNLNSQLNLYSRMINKLSKRYYFTLKIAQKIQNNNSLEDQSDNFIIESASDNVSQFLNITEDELLGTNIKSLISKSDHKKIQNIFKICTNYLASSECLKPRLFVCKMLCTSKPFHSETSNQNNEALSKDLKNSETMVFIPINTSNNLESTSITFAVKEFKISKANVRSIKAQLSPSVSLILPSNLDSVGIFNNPNKEINMDQFNTKMTVKGLILSAETDHLKSSFCISSNVQTTTGKSGLISDIKMGKKVYIFDYVHCNDQNHIMQHIHNVVNKSENTSAIYRLKINEKYVFLQTQSKIIFTRNDEQPVISSIHSIIKEIDTDVELKGNASTSLMKTLISKKPLMAVTSSKNTGQLNNILESLAIEDQNSTKKNEYELISSDRKKTSSPIGTKFALNMLGLTSSIPRIDSFFKNTENVASKSSEDLRIDNCTQIINKDLLFEINRKKQNDLKKDNQNKVSLKKDNNFLKKLLTEGGQDNEADSNNENKIQHDSSIGLVHPPMTSSPISSPINSPSSLPQSSDNVKNKSSTKCDIILRTLLNTSDIEPQILEFESVFDVNNNKETITKKQQRKDEYLFCETQNQHSPTINASTRHVSQMKRQKKKSDDTLDSLSVNSQNSAEPRKRKKSVKVSKDADLDMSPAQTAEKIIVKKAPTTKVPISKRNKLHSNNNSLTASYTSDTNIVYDASHNNDLGTYDFQQHQQSQTINSQSKMDKVSYANYLNKENDLIERQQQHLQPRQNQYSISQNYLNSNSIGESGEINNTSYNSSQSFNSLNNINVNTVKKMRVEVNSHMGVAMYQNQFIANQSQQATFLQKISTKDGYTFPSSLASSNISVSSSSSLSSPSTNTLNGNSVNNYGESLFIQNKDLHNSTNNNNVSLNDNPFLSLPNELIDDFNLSQQISDNNVTHTTNEILNELDSIADLEIKNTGLSIIVDTNISKPTSQNILKLNESNTRNSISNISATSSPITHNGITKEDDLTKKKRIEAISKHLKFDLETFKSAQFSDNNMLYEGQISNPLNSPTLLTTIRQPAQTSLFNNDSFEQDLNNSFASTNCLSPISSSSVKLHNTMIKFDDLNTPNITIEPTGFTQDGIARNFKIPSTSNTILPNKTSEPSTSINNTMQYVYSNQPPPSNNISAINNSFISLNQSSLQGSSTQQQNNFKTDHAQINLRKKLQERIQRNNITTYQISSNNSTNTQPFYKNNQQEILPHSQQFFQTSVQTPPNNNGIQYNSPGSNFTSQTNFNQLNLPSTPEHNSIPVDNVVDLNTCSSNNYENYLSSSPIGISSNIFGSNIASNNFLVSDDFDEQKILKTFESGDFVKKQLGNTVNKRMHQQTKNSNLVNFGYNNESSVSTSLLSTDMQANIHQYPLISNTLVQHQPQYQQNNSQQIYSQTVSLSEHETSDQMSLSTSASSYANQYCLGNSNKFQRQDFSHNKNTTGFNNNRQLFQKSHSLIGSESLSLPEYSNSLGYQNNQISSFGTNNQQMLQTTPSQQYQQIQNTSESFNLNNSVTAYESSYYHADHKGSLLQQLLLD